MHISISLLLLPLCLAGCAADLHRAPGPGEPDVIPITEELLAAQGGPAPEPAAGVGGAAVSPAAAGTSASGLQDDSMPAGPYRLGAGDVLAITVWDHPELTGAVARDQGGDGGALGPPAASFVIDQDGMLEFPFAGKLHLAGHTREQARTLLAARLARYFRAPRVTVSVQAYRSQRVYLDGEVKAPGLLAINDIPMTLLEAINRAGGMLPGADQSRITIERGGQRHRVDLVAALRGNRHPAALLLADGDIVRVPPRDESKVFVGGEVLAPRALTMHDGRLTLNEALGEAGGISPQSGDAGQVYVVRHTPQGARVYRLDARPARAMALAEQFELWPRDVVYVAASPLANWHRTISQLFPGELSSAVGATTRP
ncbi:hypothetical protein RugamoR57_50020 [Duganella caerulea]|uniref:polysaccharide biosynthesis/export family protein n=1 Tax=Duganella caerulea TaxID=2885762 RepID=UPI0030E78C97